MVEERSRYKIAHVWTEGTKQVFWELSIRYRVLICLSNQNYHFYSLFRYDAAHHRLICSLRFDFLLLRCEKESVLPFPEA